MAALIHDPLLDTDSALLEGLAASALMMLDNARLVAELRASRTRIVESSERERRRLERDLHDGAQQRLMAIQVKLRLAQQEFADDDGLAEQLDTIAVDAQEAVEELRRLAQGIYPPVLRDYGPADALRAFAARAPLPVTVEDDGIGRCPRTIEAAIYFCSTEATQNAAKHAGDGARVTITLGRQNGNVHFVVADDGIGINGSRNRDGAGLLSMRDRVSAVGGRLEITSSPGAGTRVEGAIPAG